MRDMILPALERSRADYTDIRVERRWRTVVAYEGPELDTLSTSTEVGGIVRCLVGGGWGVAVFNSLDRLPERVQDAERIARLAAAEVEEPITLAAVAPVQDEVRVELARDPRQVPLQEKQSLIEAYNKILLGHSDKIVTTQTYYNDTFSEVWFANSEGALILEERPDVQLLFGPTAREGDNVQNPYESTGGAAGFDVALGHEALAEKAARRAVELLQARPAKGGVYTVVLDNQLTGVFIHEAFGHLCEADFLAKNPEMRDILRLGRVFGPPALNVLDEGYVAKSRGNYKYDDEGTPRRQAYLIRNGVLEGFLHSRETAGRMGMVPTGNARAISYRFEPIVRMRNTYVGQGNVPFEEMIRDIDYGIYACGAVGGNTALEQFTFSADHAYEIVDGQVGGMLRDVVLAGNIFETLRNIEAIGDDMQVINSAGGCGKGGQMGLPVTDGGPHLRIRDVTVGGRAQ
ncbi:MAG: TldD/PmbA family protein [Anaerolineae bacterium]|nr:TldD/PmbA family protein [Anaerolineae bacterium]